MKNIDRLIKENINRYLASALMEVKFITDAEREERNAKHRAKYAKLTPEQKKTNS